MERALVREMVRPMVRALVAGVGGGVVADWHVDGAVSSSGDGISRATAFKTIQEALDNASLAAGQSIAVYPGTYPEKCTLKKSGAEGSPITLKGGLGTPIINAGDLLVGWVPCTDQADALGSANWAHMFKAFVPSSNTMPPTAYNLRQSGVGMYLPIKGASGKYATNDDLFNAKNWPSFKDAGTSSVNGNANTYGHDSATTLADPSGGGGLSNYADDADLDNAYALLHFGNGNNSIWRKTLTYDDGTKTFSFDTSDTAQLTGKYAIVNVANDIFAAGQWAFKDATEGDGTRKVVCWPLDPGAMDDIRVSARTFGIDVAGESYWTIQDIEAHGQSGTGQRDGVGFGTHTHNADVKNGLLFDRCATRHTLNRLVNGTAGGAFNIEGSGSTEIEYRDCEVERAQDSHGMNIADTDGAKFTRPVLSWIGGSGLRPQGSTDVQIVSPDIENLFGAHGNGGSLYGDSVGRDLEWVLLAYAKIRTGYGIGVTWQRGTNILAWCCDIQIPVGDLGGHRGMENNASAAPNSAGGAITLANCTVGPGPDQVLTDASRAVTTGNTIDVTHNAINIVAHGGVAYQVGTTAPAGATKGDISNNVLTALDSSQAATDAFFTTDQNSLRAATIADVFTNYASGDYRPVSGGPLDGTGKDPSTLLAPFREHFPDFDFDRDINGDPVDWTTNPFIGAYKPAVTLSFDRAPDAFTFTDVTNQTIGAGGISSGPVQITGLVGQVWAQIASGSAANKQLRVLASDGATVIDNWRSGPALIKSGQYLDVRGDASGSASTDTTVVAQVGTATSTFTITTTASVPYQDIVDLATADGWYALYDISNPGKRTLSGANVTGLKDALSGAFDDLGSTSPYGQYTAGGFGQLDAITLTGSSTTSHGMLGSGSASVLSQPYCIMLLMKDTSGASQAQRDLVRGGTGLEFFTRNVTNNPLAVSAGTIQATTTAKDGNAHVVEVLVNGSSSQMYIDGTLVTGSINPGTGGMLQPLSIGTNGSNSAIWQGLIGAVLVFNGNPGSTKRSNMRQLLGSLAGITVAP